jgi:F-type H+-transporting ATPase subunit gamma
MGVLAHRPPGLKAVSQRQELLRKRQGLGEIREIMESLKTMALIETGKVSHALLHQTSLLRNVEEMGWRLRFRHTDLGSEQTNITSVGLLGIGSERGFCGDLNSVIKDVASAHQGLLILMGTRLCERTEESIEGTRLPGLNVAEDAPSCVEQALSVIDQNPQVHWKVVFQDSEGVQWHPLNLPTLSDTYQPQAYPPDLYLHPAKLWRQLTRQYTVESLYLCLLRSFLFENQRRLQHLDGAVQHLDKNLEYLQKKQNRLRQEDITQELEVLLTTMEGSALQIPSA